MEILGLILGVLGTGIAFFYGFPQPDFEESVGLAVADNTPVGDGLTAAQYAELQRRKKKIHKAMSYVALSLILLGFVSQLLALSSVELTFKNLTGTCHL